MEERQSGSGQGFDASESDQIASESRRTHALDRQLAGRIDLQELRTRPLTSAFIRGLSTRTIPSPAAERVPADNP